MDRSQAGRGGFQVLVAVASGCVAAGLVTTLGPIGPIPVELRVYQDSLSPGILGRREAVRALIYLPVTLLTLYALFGLLRFRRSAHALFPVAAVLMILAVEFLRPYVHPGSGEPYYEAFIVLSGLLLVLLYFTPMKRWYAPVPPMLVETPIPVQESQTFKPEFNCILIGE